jgi:hypothetical protein
MAQRFILCETPPKGKWGRGSGGFSRIEVGGDHALLFSKPHATVQPSQEWVANGTRTRNNQNHNLELYH